MDDLTQQIQQILSDPQSMQQLQGILNSLGNSGENHAAPPPAAPGPSSPDLSSLLAGLGSAAGKSGPAPGGISPESLALVTRMAPLLTQANREDDATRLLRALRPLLSPARQKKVDEAVRILQMLRLLPLLKESGVFSGLLSGLL